MEIERLCKDDFVDSMRGEPTIRFTNLGVVFLNKCAVQFLKLEPLSAVSICRDPKEPSDFSITKGAEGWMPRPGTAGGAVFNCVGLARHVIDKTWERSQSHPVHAEKPRSYTFRIARLPLDDGENKNVYSLLRKKEG